MSELIRNLINSVMDELRSVAKAEVVVGKEIEFDGKKVIPVSRVSIKFLVGGGEDRSGRKGYGSGGIGDAKVEPVAFLISDGKEIKALQLKGNGVSSLIDIVPKVVDALLEKGEGQKEEKKKEKNFFKFAKEKK